MATCWEPRQVGQVNVHERLFLDLHANLQFRLLVSDSDNTDVLEEYWDEHGVAKGDAEDYMSPQLSPFSVAQRHSRALSSATLGTDDKQTLPAFHPALSILECLDTFGPLIFPLHRIALLRKRILLITSAPVRRACEFGMNPAQSSEFRC
jgi:hypothetical protein